MRLLCLDVETIQPGWDPPLREDGSKPFAPIALHQPVAICAVALDDSGTLADCQLWHHAASALSICADALDDSGTSIVLRSMVYYGEAGGAWEREALIALGDAIRHAWQLVTFNGRGFDMPLLSMRAARLGVDWQNWIDNRHRFESYKRNLFHYDLVEQLSNYGAARSIGSLAQVCNVFGIDAKTDLHGAEVPDAIERGEYRRVAAYCLEDVVNTLLVHLAIAPSFYGMEIESAKAAAFALKVEAEKWRAEILP